ncbi:MAG TPA: hypothetical protein EYN93_06490 [Planctomycetaceae bacterium]|nr:hypothetical protein [Planctomycetaceae bacterium]
MLQTEEGPVDLQLVDLNFDGRVDAIVTNSKSNSLSIFLAEQGVGSMQTYNVGLVNSKAPVKNKRPLKENQLRENTI